VKTFFGFLLVVSNMQILPACAAQDDVDPEIVVPAAIDLLLENHIRQGIDHGERSRAWARRFMLTLDPHRMHFLSSDASEFMKHADLLLAARPKGSVGFALRVFERFQERLRENAELITMLLNTRHNFSIKESVSLEHVKYAVDKAENDDRWRRRIKYELLMENPSNPNSESSHAFLVARYSTISKHVQSLGQPDVVSLYIDALAKSFDGDSAFYSEAYLAMFRTGLISNYTIGLIIDYRRGDLWITRSTHGGRRQPDDLIGCRIVAVQPVGRAPIHLTGLTEGTALRTLISPIGELGYAESIVLHIDNPTTGRRESIACDRWNR
jgi:carboxyl-terminal processing protease